MPEHPQLYGKYLRRTAVLLPGVRKPWDTEIDKSEFEAEVCIMNIGFWSCIILVIPFLIIGVLFAIFKEKAAKFVSGFNSFSKEEQALYDKARSFRKI